MRPRRLGLLFAISIAACGGTQHAPAAASGSGTGVASGSGAGSAHGTYSTQYQCVLADGQDPAACVSSGKDCSLGPPLACSGIERPPPPPNQPCACTCEP